MLQLPSDDELFTDWPPEEVRRWACNAARFIRSLYASEERPEPKRLRRPQKRTKRTKENPYA